MLCAISAIAAAFCSRFMRLLRRASRAELAPAVWGSAVCADASGRGGRLRIRSCAGRIDLDAGTHGRGEGDRLDVAALGPRRLRADDLLQQRQVVAQQRAVVEARLADRQVDVGGAVGAVLDLAGLGLLDRLGDVHRHRADARVGHLALRAEDAAEAADDRHHVRRRDRHVEVGEAALDALGEVLGADDVRARVLGLLDLVALGEDGDRHVSAQPVRQRDGAAQLLVGVADVEPGADVDLDGLVELRAPGLLDESDRLGGRVLALAVDLVARLEELLAVARHYRPTSTPIERAVPAMIFIAWSTSCALRSLSFFSAIARSWSGLIVPTFSRCGSPDPFSMPIAWRMSTAAGGVLVMKVNERSSKTVMTTGIVVPMSPCVWALNALTNSMMLIPCWPRAGPTGGAGEAWPPGACSFMVVRTFFAMKSLSPARRDALRALGFGDVRSSSPGRSRLRRASPGRRWIPAP